MTLTVVCDQCGKPCPVDEFFRSPFAARWGAVELELCSEGCVTKFLLSKRDEKKERAA